MPVDKFGRMSDKKTRDTGVSLSYINNNYIRSDGGTPVTGSIDMGGNTLHNVAEPKKPQDVATKDYADYIKASIQDYVDYTSKELLEKTRVASEIYRIVKRTLENQEKHIVLLNASYTGPLRENEFQFSFGGNEAKNSITGFLIPHSGRIKKIKNENPN